MQDNNTEKQRDFYRDQMFRWMENRDAELHEANILKIQSMQMFSGSIVFAITSVATLFMHDLLPSFSILVPVVTVVTVVIALILMVLSIGLLLQAQLKINLAFHMQMHKDLLHG